MSDSDALIYQTHPIPPIPPTLDLSSRTVAYFSMEIALDPALPTYSGGLGILAGDILRSAADLGVPMIGVMLLYHGGYFVQRLDAAGNQSEAPDAWNPRARLTVVDRTVVVT